MNLLKNVSLLITLSLFGIQAQAANVPLVDVYDDSKLINMNFELVTQNNNKVITGLRAVSRDITGKKKTVYEDVKFSFSPKGFTRFVVYFSQEDQIKIISTKLSSTNGGGIKFTAGSLSVNFDLKKVNKKWQVIHKDKVVKSIVLTTITEPGLFGLPEFKGVSNIELKY